MRNRWKRSIASIMLLVMMLVVLPTNVAQAATYQRGSKGTNVQYLQQNLSFLGCSPGSADGSYGAKTVAAVKSLQKMLHMEETGVVDDELDALIKGTVRDVQTYLQKKGFYSGELDGIKGSMMAAGYKKLQKELGYQQNGVLDLKVAKSILQDKICAGTLNSLLEFVERCENVYEDKNAVFMERMEKCIRDLELVNAEGIATTNVTVELSKLMEEITTKNGTWKLDSMPKIKDAVKYSADLLLTLYNSILSENMRLQKLQEIEAKSVAECQALIDNFFKDANQALVNMSVNNQINSKNRERAEELNILLAVYQDSLPSCQEVYNYAVKKLASNGGKNVVVHSEDVYFVCGNFDKKYVYNQNAYDKFDMPGRGNVGCTATALAISYSIYNDLFLMPDNEDIAWDEEKYVMVLPWEPHMKCDTYYHSDVTDNTNTKVDERLRYFYDNYVVADIPVIVRLERVNNPKDGDNGHSVVLVGIRVDADIEKLTYDDFLVADPNGGTVHTLTESMENGKYRLSSGWYLFYPNDAQ